MKKHLVLATCGTTGDILPFLEIGKYLCSKHHDVVFMTNPYFEDVVRSNGLAFTPFGTREQYMDALNDPAMWNPKRGFQVFWAKTIRPNMSALRSYVESLDSERNVLIVSCAALSPLANIAKGGNGNVKVILAYAYPAIIRTYFGRRAMGGGLALPKYPKALRKLLYLLADKLISDVCTVPDINKERVKLGMPTIDHFFVHLQSSADAYVALFPEWYDRIQPDYPKPLISGDFVFCASPNDVLSEEVSKFVDAGQPPILFTAGTGNKHAKKFFEIAADAVKDLNARAVFLTKFREQLAVSLPSSVLWQEYVPLRLILPKVSVIVHHGGIGTVAEASAAGVPQLIVPFSFDQFDNALIIKNLCLGDSIQLGSLNRRTLIRKLSLIQRSRKIEQTCSSVAARYRTGLGTSQVLEKIFSAT